MAVFGVPKDGGREHNRHAVWCALNGSTVPPVPFERCAVRGKTLFARLRTPLEFLIIILISSSLLVCALGWWFGHEASRVLFEWSLHLTAIATHVLVAEFLVAQFRSHHGLSVAPPAAAIPPLGG